MRAVGVASRKPLLCAVSSLTRDDDLPNSLCLSLRFPDKVHSRRQRPNIIRAGMEVEDLPPADVEQHA
jgi:hypothetical protein